MLRDAAFNAAPSKSIRVLVVDDSAFMRYLITKQLEADSSIEVAGSARDGIDAIEKIAQYKPDVVTLDLEMPRMHGLTALEQIMKENPVPVILLSTLTQEGAAVTIRGLELGAVDFVTKPSVVQAASADLHGLNLSRKSRLLQAQPQATALRMSYNSWPKPEACLLYRLLGFPHGSHLK